jgi:hypothetical protein
MTAEAIFKQKCEELSALLKKKYRVRVDYGYHNSATHHGFVKELDNVNSKYAALFYASIKKTDKINEDRVYYTNDIDFYDLNKLDREVEALAYFSEIIRKFDFANFHYSTSHGNLQILLIDKNQINHGKEVYLNRIYTLFKNPSPVTMQYHLRNGGRNSFSDQYTFIIKTDDKDKNLIEIKNDSVILPFENKVVGFNPEGKGRKWVIENNVKLLKKYVEYFLASYNTSLFEAYKIDFSLYKFEVKDDLTVHVSLNFTEKVLQTNQKIGILE